MKSRLFLFVIAVTTIFSSCEKVVGEGPVVTQVRSLEGFKGVSVSISGQVVYKIAPEYKVEVRGQQNIVDILQTTLVGDDLVVKFEDGKNVRSTEEITVLIEAPVAQWLNLSGSAELKMEGKLVTGNFGLRVSGSGNIDAEELEVSNQLNATISGSGNIMVRAGTAKNETLKVSGSGNIHLEDVAAEKVVTEISGSGNVQVAVSQSLDATISGSGSVLYLGTPLVTAHISGSGKVKPL